MKRKIIFSLLALGLTISLLASPFARPAAGAGALAVSRTPIIGTATQSAIRTATQIAVQTSTQVALQTSTQSARQTSVAQTHSQISLQGAPPGAWAGVQWQSDSGWQDVPGWQGAVNAAGQVNWGVAPQDQGSGWYRWQVFDRPGGSLRGTSASFRLPLAGATQLVTWTASAAPVTPTPAGRAWWPAQYFRVPSARIAYSSYAPDCAQMLIEGRLLAYEDKPAQAGAGARVYLTLPSGRVRWVTADDQGSFYFWLPKTAAGGAFSLRLQSASGGQRLSDALSLQLQPACDQNRATLVWSQMAP